MRRLRFEDAKVGDIVNIRCMDDCRCTGRIKETLPDIKRIRFKGLEAGDCGSVVMTHPKRKIFLIFRPESWEEIELERDPPVEDMWGFGLTQARAEYGRTFATITAVDIAREVQAQIADAAVLGQAPPPQPIGAPEWEEPRFRTLREEQEYHRRAGIAQAVGRWRRRDWE